VTKDARLALVLAINLAMVGALLAVGLLSHSLGVLASGADYLGDALGAGLALLAQRASRRRAGRSRAISLAALVNAALLLAVTAIVAVGAVRRLLAGTPSIHGLPVIIVSVVAAAAMVACALILGDVEDDLSMQSVMLDTIADAAAAIGVAISGAIILATGGSYWLDSAVALVISVAVGYHAVKLMRRATAEARRPPARTSRPAA
jgi:cobalt-zinc-cadmium efflux system protein